MLSHRVVPIKYRNKCLIFSYYGARRDTYISCKADEDTKCYWVESYGMFGAYCHEFKYGYIKCLRSIKIKVIGDYYA